MIHTTQGLGHLRMMDSNVQAVVCSDPINRIKGDGHVDQAPSYRNAFWF